MLYSGKSNSFGTVYLHFILILLLRHLFQNYHSKSFFSMSSSKLLIFCMILVLFIFMHPKADCIPTHYLFSVPSICYNITILAFHNDDTGTVPCIRNVLLFSSCSFCSFTFSLFNTFNYILFSFSFPL